MNELLQTMLSRRSVRKYTGEPIPEEKLSLVLQAALTSASGKAAYPCEYVVVTERAALDKLAECRTGAGQMLKKAGAAIVVLGDENKTDTIIEDCSIALTNMHLMADSLGLGSCWIQGRLRQAPDGRSAEEYVRDLLGFPANCRLEAILSLGIPEEHPAPRRPEELQTVKIHRGRF